MIIEITTTNVFNNHQNDVQSTRVLLENSPFICRTSTTTTYTFTDE